MRHVTIIALLVGLAAAGFVTVPTSHAHHVGMSDMDYNDIGPCPEDYFYDPDSPDTDYTDCWNVHGGVGDDGLYFEPNRGNPTTDAAPTTPARP